VHTRSPIYADGYKPHFSGHETFPLRYGWLKKAYDEVASQRGIPGNKAIFRGEDGIARFGVGKNMVASMRHWATCCGIIHETPGDETLSPTPIGDLLFGPKGLDPFMEHPATLWLLHWMLCATGDRPSKTTWYWAFSHYAGLDFEKDDLIEGLSKLVALKAWPRVAAVTVKNDVDCFVKTYEARSATGDSIEDMLASPLSELGLLRVYRGHFQFVRGVKRSLPNGLFAFALNEFWKHHVASNSMSLETIAHGPGGPGRIFLLDEADLAERLLALEETTTGALRWSETAGLKQVLRHGDLSDNDAVKLLRSAYPAPKRREAA
jgi:uncharacterized protein DUF4007